MLDVLPKKYIDSAFNPDEDSFSFDPEDKLLSALQICFRQALSLVPKEVMQVVVEKFVSILKEEDGFTVKVYETAFFKAADLICLSDENATLVKEHLFSRLKEEVTSPILQMLEGIGVFIKAEEIVEFVDPLIRTAIWGASKSLKDEAKSRLENEYYLADVNVSKRFINRLNEWAAHFEHRDQSDFATQVRDLRSKIEITDSDIPF